MKKSGKKAGDASPSSGVGGMPIIDTPVSQAVAGVAGPGAVLARDAVTMNGNLYPGASSVWESMIPLLSKELSPAAQYNIVIPESSKLTETMKQPTQGGGVGGTMQPSLGHDLNSQTDNTSRIGTGDGSKAPNQVGGGGKKKTPYIPAPPVCRPEAPIADELEMMMLRDRVLRPTPPVTTTDYDDEQQSSNGNHRHHVGQRVGSLSMPRSTVSGDYSRSLSPGYSEATGGGGANATLSSPQPPKALRGTASQASQEPNSITNVGRVDGTPKLSKAAYPQGFIPAQEGTFKGESMTQGVFVVNTVAMDNVQRTGIPLPGAGTTNIKFQKNPALAVAQGPASNPKKRKGPSSKKKASEVIGFAGVSLPSAPAPPSDLPVVFPHPVVVGNVSYVNPKYSAPSGVQGGNGKSGGVSTASSSAASPGRQGGGGGEHQGPSEPLPFRTAPIPVTSPDVIGSDQTSAGGGVTTPASSYFYGYSRPHAIPSGPHTSSLPVPIPIAGSTNAPNGGSPPSAGTYNVNRTSNNVGSRGGGGGGQAMMTVPGVMMYMKDPTQPMLISESNCQQRTELMNRLRGSNNDNARPNSTATGEGGSRDIHPRSTSKPSPPLSPLAPETPTSAFSAYTLSNRPPQHVDSNPINKDRLQPRPPRRNDQPFDTTITSNHSQLQQGKSSYSSPGRNLRWTSSEGKETSDESTQKLNDLKGFLLSSENAALEAPRAIDRYNTALHQYKETQRVLVEAVQDHHDEAALLLHERARIDSERSVLQSRISLLRGTLRLMDVDHHRRHEKQKLDHGIEMDKLREELETLEDDRERTQTLLQDKRETLAATAEADTSLIRLTRQYEVDEKHLTSQLAEERERLAQTMSGKLKRTFTEMAALASRQQGDREVRAAQEASRLAEELKGIERSSGELNQRMSALKTTLASCDRNISLEKQRYDMLRVKNIKLAKQVGSAVDELRNLEGLYLNTVNTNLPPPTISPLPPPSPRGAKNGTYTARTIAGGAHSKVTSINSAPISRSAHFVAPLNTIGGGVNASVTTVTNTKNAIAEARELAREVDDERRVVKGLREHNDLILRQMESVQLEVRGARAALVQRIAYADAPISSSHVIAVLQELELLSSNNKNIIGGVEDVAGQGEGSRATSSLSTHNTATTATTNDPNIEGESLFNVKGSDAPSGVGTVAVGSTAGGIAPSSSSGVGGPLLSSVGRVDFLKSDRYARALLPIAAIAQSAVEELSAHYIETTTLQQKIQEARLMEGGGGGLDRKLLSSGVEESATPLMLAAAAGSVSMLSIASVSGIGGQAGPWGNFNRGGGHGARQTSASSGLIIKAPPATNSPPHRGGVGGVGSAPPSMKLTSVDQPSGGFRQPSMSSYGADGGGQQFGRAIALLCEHADPHEKRMIQDYVASRINKRLSAFHPLANVLGGGGSRLTTGLSPPTRDVSPSIVATPNEMIV